MQRRKFIGGLGAATLLSGVGFFGVNWVTITKTYLKSGCNKIGLLASKLVKGDPEDIPSKEQLKSIIEEEYAAGKTVLLDSWLYSETEAKVAALRASSSSESQCLYDVVPLYNTKVMPDVDPYVLRIKAKWIRIKARIKGIIGL